MTDLADLIIEDYGHCAKGLESTVAGVMNNELRIFRQGAIYIDL
jgi:tRNA A37 threonylcarbamoyladenosine synthetase subunit TsaC/SUA5/YrdC